MKGRNPAAVSELTYTADEMMTVAAARALRDGMTCFVGIGLPSAAANLARATHAPGLVLIYESGPRSSTTGCSRGASTSDSWARPRSTSSATSTPR